MLTDPRGRSRALLLAVLGASLLAAGCTDGSVAGQPAAAPSTTAVPSPSLDPSPSPTADPSPTPTTVRLSSPGPVRDCTGVAGVCFGDTRDAVVETLGEPNELEEHGRTSTLRYRFDGGARLRIEVDAEGLVHFFDASTYVGGMLPVHDGVMLGTATFREVVDARGMPSHAMVHRDADGGWYSTALSWPGGPGGAQELIYDLWMREDAEVLAALLEAGVDFDDNRLRYGDELATMIDTLADVPPTGIQFTN